ncbi:MAG: response regulator [Terracidiphilus sp.]|jgi:DNA-binding NtrC family response regulator
MSGKSANRKVLVLDDEEAIADTLAVILRTRGYAIKVAYSAETAIEIISDWTPDVAIVDVMLPLMNGIDFSIVLKSNHPDCKVVLFSGQPDTSTLLAEAARHGHYFDILAKPLHPAFILDKVESLLTANQRPLTDA